jgi:hypothetical protein
MNERRESLTCMLHYLTFSCLHHLLFYRCLSHSRPLLPPFFFAASSPRYQFHFSLLSSRLPPLLAYRRPLRRRCPSSFSSSYPCPCLFYCCCLSYQIHRHSHAVERERERYQEINYSDSHEYVNHSSLPYRVV